jgi:hypothetical protein
MVDFKRLADRAKALVDKRGGTESLKEDAAELKDIAKSKGSLGDKAKSAVDAVKEPGDGETADAPAAAEASAPERERATEKVEGEARGKHGAGGHGRGGAGGGGTAV